jgi:hypothetical protein
LLLAVLGSARAPAVVLAAAFPLLGRSPGLRVSLPVRRIFPSFPVVFAEVGALPLAHGRLAFPSVLAFAFQCTLTLTPMEQFADFGAQVEHELQRL